MFCRRTTRLEDYIKIRFAVSDCRIEWTSLNSILLYNSENTKSIYKM